MKKTLNLDEGLLREARLACGATTDTETVRLGLEALVRQAAYRRLRAPGRRAGGPRCAQTARATRQGEELALMVLVDTSVWVRRHRRRPPKASLMPAATAPPAGSGTWRARRGC